MIETPPTPPSCLSPVKLERIADNEDDAPLRSCLCRWQSCMLSFPSPTALTEHIAADHVGRRQNVYTCHWLDCARAAQRPFLQREKMMIHIRAAHTGERPYVCDTENCGRAFTRKDARDAHKRTHDTSMRLSCPVMACRRMYHHAKSMRKHVRKDHVAMGHLSPSEAETLLHRACTSPMMAYSVVSPDEEDVSTMMASAFATPTMAQVAASAFSVSPSLMASPSSLLSGCATPDVYGAVSAMITTEAYPTPDVYAAATLLAATAADAFAPSPASPLSCDAAFAITTSPFDATDMHLLADYIKAIDGFESV